MTERAWATQFVLAGVVVIVATALIFPDRPYLAGYFFGLTTGVFMTWRLLV